MTVEEAFSMTGKDVFLAALPVWFFLAYVVVAIVAKIVAFFWRM